MPLGGLENSNRWGMHMVMERGGEVGERSYVVGKVVREGRMGMGWGLGGHA